MLDKLENYFEGLKNRGEKVPSQVKNSRPHLRVISAASGVPYRHLNAAPLRLTVSSAAREIGLEKRHYGNKCREDSHEQNRARILTYVELLKANGLKLPEDPDRRGEVFFRQVEVESGVGINTMLPRNSRPDDSRRACLRDMVRSAASAIGVDSRVLPRVPGRMAGPMTYGQLMKGGTAERKLELQGKASSAQQLYNTRWALRRFCKALDLEPASAVGAEFITDFEERAGKVGGGMRSAASRKKFHTEINWWRGFYLRFVKGQSLPDDFHEAIALLVDDSGLPSGMIARLADIPRDRLRDWCRGISTPDALSRVSLSKVEALFKLPAGTLIDKVSPYRPDKRFRGSRLPDFLRQDVVLRNRVTKHLPDDFCDLPIARQREIVGAIRDNILTSPDVYSRRAGELQKLPYRLKDWPRRLEQEFEELASFKTAARPPLGMTRSGQWRPTTREFVRQSFAYFFGALRLSPDAEDVRLRGLGVRREQLTLALLACPALVDWYIRFICEARNTYTSFAPKLLQDIKSLLRRQTGWLRQRPRLASRLRPISCGATELVSAELITKARSDWGAFCDDAINHLNQLVDDITPLVKVSREPFRRIGGIVNGSDPLEGFRLLFRAMEGDTPSPKTHPTLYHIRIRNRALLMLIAMTGLRRNTVSQLDYTGDEAGHLIFQDGRYVLTIPRALFKEEDSPYFGYGHSRGDYYMELPDVYGLYRLLEEYLNVSLPFLLGKYHPSCEDRPLFVGGMRSLAARLSPEYISVIYYGETEKHLAENIWRGTGKAGVWRHGPHTARHMRATGTLKMGGSFQDAADSIHVSVATARAFYTLFKSQDRNRRVNDILFRGVL